MKKAKILIVDDYQENITALANLIAADDIEVHSAKNADAALELLTYNDFALALLDIQMPVVTGLELAQLIRGVKKYQHLPIIFVTAQQHDNSLIFQGYENGAVDLLFKPLNPYVVRSKVRVFVELSRQRDLLQTHVDELEKLRLEAESANIAKSQFLANMSHEIRTPLAAVMGFSDLLINDNTTPEEKQEWAAAVRRNGNLLMRLIDDILDISKIEADRLEFDRASFSLEDFLQDVNSTLAFKAKDKGIDLEFHLPSTCQKYYSSDSTRIKQILLNVIGNAIKFTTKGKVRVDVNLTSASLQSDTLKVLVQDDGVGLSREQISRLFQPFSQGDASTRRQFGGTGLGLAISRRLARALGGDIRLVNSTPGGGSTFEIKILLPYADGPESKADVSDKMFSQPKPSEKDVTDFSGKSLLAVDDSPDNLFLIEMFLKTSGIKLTCVESGKEAVDQVKNHDFDLILMDMQMAGMDGREATGIIRGMGFQRPILAFTAHAMPEEHSKCKAAGCDDVIVKPIDSKKLIEGLRPYLI
jgi:two-component system, sensor histidine kinase